MKNDLDLFEDREKDWLAKEIRRENLLVTEFDINDAKKLKMEHYQRHHSDMKPVNNKQILDTIFFIIFIFIIVIVVFVFRAMVRSFF